jgi:single-strand DNA-binding protein
MASDNQITIVGNLTDDPELRYTPNGAAVANVRVAVNRRIPDGAGGWKDAETSFFRVNAWRTLAENAAESLTRGTRVVVTGRLRSRSWENQEGETRSAVEIEADEIGPSLRWATAKVEKQSRSGGAGGDWSENVSVGTGDGGGGGGTEETPVESG